MFEQDGQFLTGLKEHTVVNVSPAPSLHLKGICNISSILRLTNTEPHTDVLFMRLLVNKHIIWLYSVWFISKILQIWTIQTSTLNYSQNFKCREVLNKMSTESIFPRYTLRDVIIVMTSGWLGNNKIGRHHSKPMSSVQEFWECL